MAILRERILDLYSKSTRSKRARQKIINLYKNSINNISDEPSFASVLKEVEQFESVNLFNIIIIISKGGEDNDNEPRILDIENYLIYIKGLFEGLSLINNT